MFRCKGKDSSRYILNMLKSLDSLFRQSIPKWITEVQSGSNESMHKYVRRMATDIFPYAANASRVVEACLAYGCNMMFHRHECIIQNTNVSSYRWLANHLYHHKPTEIDIRGGGTRWHAFSTTSSVLSLFILSMFTVCHPSIEISHTVFIANFSRSAEDDSKVTYNCVSLAYKWKATLLVSHNITQGWRIKQE